MARPILEQLRAQLPLARYVAFDPVVSQADIAAFGLQPVVDFMDAFVDANVVIILNNHPIFESMPLESLAATMARPGLIYDCWNLFTPVDFELPGNVAYVGLGGHTVLD
jgi:UDP-N-acetyl-D-mannosaminuronate dehydrogenase